LGDLGVSRFIAEERIERAIMDVSPVRARRLLARARTIHFSNFCKPEGGRVRGSADFSKNNLDCLRLILASTVALFHVNALSGIPAFSAFGRYLSPHFAVRSFFVISGLLIYRSYTRSSSLRSYLEKRVRRIYPAYFAVIVFAVIALWPLSTLPLSQ
jgi:hypothetical protein